MLRVRDDRLGEISSRIEKLVEDRVLASMPSVFTGPCLPGSAYLALHFIKPRSYAEAKSDLNMSCYITPVKCTLGREFDDKFFESFVPIIMDALLNNNKVVLADVADAAEGEQIDMDTVRSVLPGVVSASVSKTVFKQQVASKVNLPDKMDPRRT